MSTPSDGVSMVAAGVGTTPSFSTVTPAALNPAVNAASSISPEIRVSLATAARRVLRQINCPAAIPSFSANSAVIG